jgi:hypothetical protein
MKNQKVQNDYTKELFKSKEALGRNLNKRMISTNFGSTAPGSIQFFNHHEINNKDYLNFSSFAQKNS